MFKKVLPILLCLSSASAQVMVTPHPAPVPVNPPPAKVIVNSPAPGTTQSQKMIERIMAGTTGPGSTSEVTYGLLATLPLTLPTPFEVIGTVRTKYNAGNNVFYRVFASSPLSDSAARDALQELLLAQGWKMQQQGQSFGFEGNYQPKYVNFYREGSTSFTLNATVTGAAQGSNLDINLSPIAKAQLEQIKKQPAYLPRSSMPLLKVLPGSKSKTSYPSTGPAGSLSTVWVQTDKSAGEVFNHYSAQLKAAGWKAQSEMKTPTLRVVTYTLKDLNGREALGTLGIRPWEKDGGYVLTVSVQGFKP